MKLFILFSIFHFSYALADFINDREEYSFAIKKKHLRQIERLLPENLELAKDILNGERIKGRYCAEDILDPLKVAFKSKRKLLSHILLALRHEGEIDDLHLKKILQHLKLEQSKIFKFRKNTKITDSELKNRMIGLFSTINRTETCLEDKYVKVYQELKNEGQNKNFANWSYWAYGEGFISKNLYTYLRKAFKNNIHQDKITLSEYQNKIKFLRNQRSDFPGEFSRITKIKVDKETSLRMHLFQKYSSFQILLMSELITKLRHRIDSEKIQYHIFDQLDDTIPSEIITLSPGERYCFVSKRLKIEIEQLIFSSHFKGQSINYQDILMAAYEVGTIPGEEIETVLLIEELWNPKKSFIEKAKGWINMIGGVAALFIPPPYSFVPILGMMAIEFSSNSTGNQNACSVF